MTPQPRPRILSRLHVHVTIRLVQRYYVARDASANKQNEIKIKKWQIWNLASKFCRKHAVYIYDSSKLPVEILHFKVYDVDPVVH